MHTVYFFMNDTPSPLSVQNKRDAWMPKDGQGYFDKSAREYFETKRQKRTWLARHGMRETGELYRPHKARDSREGCMRKSHVG